MEWGNPHQPVFHVRYAVKGGKFAKTNAKKKKNYGGNIRGERKEVIEEKEKENLPAMGWKNGGGGGGGLSNYP